MSEDLVGHNGGPPLATPFSKRRWARAVMAHPEKPAGVVAMAFKLYMEMDGQGQGAIVSDSEFVDTCGVSERSARSFKAWLAKEGFVHIKLKGARGRGTEFIAVVPGAEIPATIAAIKAELPAPITGKTENDRQPLPVTVAAIQEQPATIAASPVSPAAIAGISQPPAPPAGNPSCARANMELPTVINNTRGGREVPHMNGKGFIISAKNDLYIPMDTVEKWKIRFADLPDLEAAMASLAALILNKGPMHTGWQCPEGWMPKILAEENQKAANTKAEHIERRKRAAGTAKTGQSPEDRKKFMEGLLRK